MTPEPDTLYTKAMGLGVTAEIRRGYMLLSGGSSLGLIEIVSMHSSFWRLPDPGVHSGSGKGTASMDLPW